MDSIDVEQLLELRSQLPVIDVRSPAEYERGHIPGAVSLPLFDNEERAGVGTTYHKKGKIEAVKEGLRIVGPKMVDLVESALQYAGNGELVLYCWRGGMRSESMAWLFERAGIMCHLLKGGYKRYRSYGRRMLNQPARLFILGGYTGSGKTDILKALSRHGQQILDLEGLARHKGSAFGALGQHDQHPNEHFENLLFGQWLRLDRKAPIWIEDESKMIGKNVIPDELFHRMRSSPVIKVDMDRSLRVERLVREYARFDKQKLFEAVRRISKRLGGEKTREAMKAIDEGDFHTAVDITLGYYDKAYEHGLSKRHEATLYPLKVRQDAPADNAAKALEKAHEILGLLNIKKR